MTTAIGLPIIAGAALGNVMNDETPKGDLNTRALMGGTGLVVAGGAWSAARGSAGLVGAGVALAGVGVLGATVVRGLGD